MAELTNVFPLELKLLGLPKMTNTSRVHWSIIHKETKLWKRRVFLALEEKGFFTKNQPPLKKAKLTLVRYSARTPDPDGLVSGFKRVVDGLVEHGVLENDSMNVIGFPTYDWQKVTVREGFITIKIEAL